MESTFFYTDNGAPCVCGGTIYQYALRQVGDEFIIDTYCFGCHSKNYFFAHVEASETSAATLSAIHRAS